MFYNFSNIQSSDLLLYGLIVFLGIYGYTSLMDNSKFAIIAETLFCGLGIYVILTTKDWFGISDFILFGSYIMLFYFVISFLGTLYFSSKLFKRKTVVISS
jgi:hypothetical protein